MLLIPDPYVTVQGGGPPWPGAAAQRQLAESNGGTHVVSLSSDGPDLQASPPRPRPDTTLGGSSSEIVYADPGTGTVTHVWDAATNTWKEK